MTTDSPRKLQMSFIFFQAKALYVQPHNSRSHGVACTERVHITGASAVTQYVGEANCEHR